MPESRKRKKRSGETAKSDTELHSSWAEGMKLSPTWWAPTMVTLMIVGLLWVVASYLLQMQYPIPGIGNWNLAIGLGVIFVGFMMTLRWR